MDIHIISQIALALVVLAGVIELTVGYEREIKRLQGQIEARDKMIRELQAHIETRLFERNMKQDENTD